MCSKLFFIVFWPYLFLNHLSWRGVEPTLFWPKFAANSFQNLASKVGTCNKWIFSSSINCSVKNKNTKTSCETLMRCLLSVYFFNSLSRNIKLTDLKMKKVNKSSRLMSWKQANLDIFAQNIPLNNELIMKIASK